MKKKIRFLLILTLILVLADQLTKLVIAGFFMQARFVLITGFLTFRPKLNTSLSYFLSGTGLAPMSAAAIGGILIGIFVFLGCYFVYYSGGKTALVLFYIFASSGIAMFTCRVVDIICWGGSLDFLEFSGIVIDFKDLYTFGAIPLYALTMLFIIQKFWRHKRLSEEQRKEKSFIGWIKKGCPLSENP